MSEMYEVTILEREGENLKIIVDRAAVTAKNRDAAILKVAVEQLETKIDESLSRNPESKSAGLNIDNLEVRTRPFVGTE